AREIYHSQRLVEDHARQILQVSGLGPRTGATAGAHGGEPRPKAIVADTDAEDRQTLKRHLAMDIVAAKKDKSPGIQAVASRLRKAGDGKPRLFIFQGALLERDPVLEERKLPCCTEQEFDGYVWDLSNGRKKGEEPVGKDDHGMDALRYMVAHVDLRP